MVEQMIRIPVYDLVDGIFEATISERALHNLIAKRHEAGYLRGEKLHEFVVGKYRFDQLGNCFEITSPEVLVELLHHSPRVMTGGEYKKLLESINFDFVLEKVVFTEVN